ncbi:hypothetical protein BOX15_Mlig010244g1 [Macrostomum lignano]|uniref:LIM zinc-binding domain-containing protein n=2 Tax=Macrostomum lignano TaxID=282301 RepID=A0A267GNQ0_9PLAT|nr:hypothetical protein BOX15_Mlig010244g1 [Macrostomum lignano]
MENVCASCRKAVYSMELLKCMDQAWHRTCFKCQTCGTTLNINNYKAYGKRPYCKVHYPESKAYTFVTDNQEIRRVKQNTAVISSASYTKRRASAISNDNSNTVVVNRRFSEIPASQSADARRSRQELQHQSSYQPGSINDFDPEEHNTLSRGLDPNAGRRGSTVFISPASSSRPASEIDSVVEVSPSEPEANNVKAEEVPLPQPAVPELKPDKVPEAKPEEVPETKSDAVPEAKPEEVHETKSDAVPEAKSEEVTEAKPDEVPEAKSKVLPEAKSEVVPEAKSEVVPEAKLEEVLEAKLEEVPEAKPAASPEAKPEEIPEAKPEEIPEAKPEEIPEAKPEEIPEAKPEEVPEAKPEEVPPSQPVVSEANRSTMPAVAAKPSAKKTRGRCFRAQFAYKAQDSDEVSFDVGDVITNGDPVDSGWMYGIVERTKQYGLLPSNYVIEEASQAF